MTWVYHPKCGKYFYAAGNASGHCDQCHRTFYGEAAWTAHQRLVDGVVVCGLFGKDWWQDPKGAWHKSKRMSDEVREQLRNV